MAKVRELDYAELKVAYNKLLNDIEDFKLMDGYKENKALKEELEKCKKIIAVQKRKIRELSLLLSVKVDGLKK